MSAVRLEILIEPFRENEPGPHVTAAIDALEAAGLSVEMGPFSSNVDGDLDAVVDALGVALKAGFGAAADRIRVNVESA